MDCAQSKLLLLLCKEELSNLEGALTEHLPLMQYLQKLCEVNSTGYILSLRLFSLQPIETFYRLRWPKLQLNRNEQAWRELVEN